VCWRGSGLPGNGLQGVTLGLCPLSAAFPLMLSERRERNFLNKEKATTRPTTLAGRLVAISTFLFGAHLNYEYRCRSSESGSEQNPQKYRPHRPQPLWHERNTCKIAYTYAVDNVGGIPERGRYLECISEPHMWGSGEMSTRHRYRNTCRILSSPCSQPSTPLGF